MAKRKFLLTVSQIAELRSAYDQSKDGAFSKKLLAVRLYGSGRKVPEVLDLVLCSRSSLMGWCRRYQENGVEGLKDQRPGGNHYRLNQIQKAELSSLVNRYSPKQLLGKGYATQSGEYWTPQDLKQLIYQKFDVIYQSPSSYRLLLTECGLSYQRTETVYKSRSEFKVADFEEQLEKN